MFIKALFMVVKIWRQPKWPSTQQQKRVNCANTQQHGESQKHCTEWKKPDPKENMLLDPFI